MLIFPRYLLTNKNGPKFNLLKKSFAVAETMDSLAKVIERAQRMPECEESVIKGGTTLA